MRRLALVVLALAAGGCSSVLSTMQPAKTTPGRHVRLGGGMGINVPIGQIADVVGDAESFGEDGMITAMERDEFLSGAVGLMMNPPAAIGEFQGRYGITDVVDVGLRAATGSNFRADMRYRMIDPGRDNPDGLYGSVGIGASYGSGAIPLPSDIEDFISIDSLSRFDLDLPLLFGWSNEIWHFWFGPKLQLSFVGTAMRFRTSPSEPQTEIEASGTNLFYLLQVGGAVGYKHVWIAIELTIGGIAGGATITDVTADEELVDASYSGVQVYPAFALLLEF